MLPCTFFGFLPLGSELVEKREAHLPSNLTFVRRQSFPNADGMAAQLSSHLYSLNRQADLSENKTDTNKRSAPIDLIVVTDSEAILGIGDQGVGGITVS